MVCIEMLLAKNAIFDYQYLITKIPLSPYAMQTSRSAFLWSVLLGLPYWLSSQTLLPRLPQHIYWKTLLNPAAKPLEHILHPENQDFTIGVAYRQQWRKQDGPRYLAARFDWMNIQKRKWLAGVGADLLSYQTDPLRRNAILGRVSFQHDLSEDWKLSSGISPGYVFEQIDRAALVVLHPADPVLAALPAFQGQFTIGAGVFAYRKLEDYECFWFGASMPQAYAQPLRPNLAKAAPKGWGKGPLYILTGIRKQVGNDQTYRFYIDLDVLFKAESKLPISFEPAIKIGLLNDASTDWWLQTGYSTTAKIIFLHAGFQKKIFNIWYLKTSAGFDRYFHKYNVQFQDNFEINLTIYRRKK